MFILNFLSKSLDRLINTTNNSKTNATLSIIPDIPHKPLLKNNANLHLFLASLQLDKPVDLINSFNKILIDHGVSAALNEFIRLKLLQDLLAGLVRQFHIAVRPMDNPSPSRVLNIYDFRDRLPVQDSLLAEIDILIAFPHNRHMKSVTNNS